VAFFAVAFFAVAFLAVAFLAVAFFAVAFLADTVTPRFAISRLVSLITSFKDTSGKRQSTDAAFGEDVDLDIGPRTSNPTQQTTWEAGLTLIVTAWAISMSFVVRAVCLVAQHLERQLLVDRVPLHQDAFCLPDNISRRQGGSELAFMSRANHRHRSMLGEDRAKFSRFCREHTRLVRVEIQGAEVLGTNKELKRHQTTGT